MTHAARTDPTLFFFLAFVTLLLVLFIGAVIVAPAAAPDSPAPLAVEPLPRPPIQAPAPPPLPRRQPLAAATTASPARWSAGAEAATDTPMPVYRGVRRPNVSGAPPWAPAVKPPGPDPWAADNLSPGWLRGPDEEPVSPRADRPASSTPPPRTPAPAGNQTSHRRHARRR